jgi:hypothetical protein
MSDAIPQDSPSLPSPPVGSEALSPLPREEYIEQAHFFSVLAQRMAENSPAQEILDAMREEVLATTKLPMAIDFLLSELRHQGSFAPGMQKLSHYFTPFQCYVMSEAENDRRRFDLRIGLLVLAREAKYRAAEHVSRQGLFVYQFETLCRNRLSYDQGIEAMSHDPSFDETWREWILTVRRQIGLVELADLIYVRSDFYVLQEQRAGRSPTPVEDTESTGLRSSLRDGARQPARNFVLFGVQEGRIAWANRKKDPLLLFAALHRHLDYPEVPRSERVDPEERLLPVLARRLEQVEARLRLLEEEQRGGIDLTRFYNANQNQAP